MFLLCFSEDTKSQYVLYFLVHAVIVLLLEFGFCLNCMFCITLCNMCIIFFDIKVPPSQGGEEVYGEEEVQIVSKIMYVRLVSHIVYNA